MSHAWLLSLSPIVGLAVDVGVQITVAHLTRRIGVSIVGGTLAGLAAAILAGAISFPQVADLAEALGVWTFVVVAYLALSFDYWVFLNLNITSLRIRILRELLRHGRGISRSNLTDEYSLEEILHRRLQRLEHGGQLAYADGRWRLRSAKLLALHRTLKFLRAIILPSNARNPIRKTDNPRSTD